MKHVLRHAVSAALLALPAALAGQQATAVYTPNPDHLASPFKMFVLGSTWRAVWGTPVRAPIIDLTTFAGGLTPFREGGNQSRTLRFRAGDGKIYTFRSTRKFEPRGLADDLKSTLAGDLIQDQTSSLFPTGARTSARLQSELQLLATTPQFVILPDHERLGKFRETFAGMLGTIEIRPSDENPDSTVTFGAKKISDTDKLLEELEESLDHQLSAREYLSARLLDFLLGDTDRGADQWQFARFDQGDIRLYRPIARDRDYAFMHSNGVVPLLIRSVFPKLVPWNHEIPSVRSLTFMTQEFDRSHLVPLPRAAWDSAIAAIESRLTDAAIDEAVGLLPPEHHELARANLAGGLKARRDQLRERAYEFYATVNRDADIFGSNEADLAEIDRRADGTVEVRLYSKKAARATGAARKPAFHRGFTPEETDEIRVYLQGGDDRVLVTGTAHVDLKVRVTGGAGDDELIDQSSGEPGRVHTMFYDAHGKNRIQPGPVTKVDTEEYNIAQPKVEYDDNTSVDTTLVVFEERRGRQQDLMNDPGKNFVQQKFSRSLHRYWGGRNTWGPAFGYGEGAGVVVGVTRSATKYGFRHDPYKQQVRLSGYYSLGAGGFALNLFGGWNPDNTHTSLSVDLNATQFAANRFYGFGNDTELLSSEQSLVLRDEVLLRPMLRRNFTSSWFGFGPVARYTRAHPEAGSPAALLTTGSYGQIGAYGQAGLDQTDGSKTSGWQINGTLSAYPPVFDVSETYLRAEAEGTGYLPLGRPIVAVRVGASRLIGDEFPLHDAAFVGGSGTLRGFRWNRFAGDTEAHGSVELRVPLARIELVTRGELSVFGLYDVARVWFEGASSGGWHNGVGGGLSFHTLGNHLTLTYARGEESRFYLRFGLPF